MRAFVARSVGTNTWITVSTDPYVNVETGTTETTAMVYDAKRPDCVLVGECKMTLVNWRNGERWIVVTDQNVAPANTYDIGDPSSQAFLDTRITNPQRNAVATFLGVPNATFNNYTWRMIFAEALAHTAAWRALFSDGQTVELLGGAP